jgi:hypothetical protein
MGLAVLKNLFSAKEEGDGVVVLAKLLEENFLEIFDGDFRKMFPIKALVG